jgi:hypothetical protein
MNKSKWRELHGTMKWMFNEYGRETASGKEHTYEVYKEDGVTHAVLHLNNWKPPEIHFRYDKDYPIEHAKETCQGFEDVENGYRSRNE